MRCEEKSRGHGAWAQGTEQSSQGKNVEIYVLEYFKKKNPDI
jgi:hypothetical protein